jgi:uncharacterized protein (TIRG00374 family)
MKKKIKIILKLFITLGFLALIFFQIDWTEAWLYIVSIDLWKLFLYIFLILLGISISAYKWKIMAEFKDIKTRNFGDYYRYYLTGTFINNFMPSFIGGDTFRAYEIGRPEKKYIEAASSVIADRLTGFIGISVLALLFGFLNWRVTLDNQILWFINSLVFLSLTLDIIMIKTSHWRFWKKILDRIPHKIARFIAAVQEYNRNQKILTRSISWGIVFQIIGVAIPNYVLFWALEINIKPLDYLSVIFLISLVSAIPISINNIGLKEWAYVTFFGIFGLPGAAVVAVSILSRFIQMLISFLALPTYLKSRR